VAKTEKKAAKNAAKQAMEKVRQIAGGQTVEDTRKNVYGVPIPYFCLRWVYDSNVHILGRIEQLVGEWGAGKTQWLLHKMRHFLEFHPQAMAHFIGTEAKDTPAQATSILGPYIDRLQYHQAKILGALVDKKGKRSKADEDDGADWMNIVHDLVDAYRAYPYPVLVGLDSLLGAPMAEVTMEIEASGGNLDGRNTFGMVRANKLTQWLPWLSSALTGTNILFVFTNHGKPVITMGKTNYGPDVKWPGGQQVGLSPNSIIYLKKGAAVKSIARKGEMVKARMWKNSNGDGTRRISVEHSYHNMRDAEGNLVRNRFGMAERELYWDWAQSTVDLLCSFFQKGVHDAQGPASYRADLAITKTGTADNPIYSIPMWGLKEVTPNVVSDYLESDSEEGLAARCYLSDFDMVNVVYHDIFKDPKK
jgi:hypothetical protein